MEHRPLPRNVERHPGVYQAGSAQGPAKGGWDEFSLTTRSAKAQPERPPLIFALGVWFSRLLVFIRRFSICGCAWPGQIHCAVRKDALLWTQIVIIHHQSCEVDFGGPAACLLWFMPRRNIHPWGDQSSRRTQLACQPCRPSQ